LWQLDFIFCSELTAWKRAIGMPWGFLLEFHGWWHVLTAVGAYVFMVMVDSLTQDTVVLSGGPFAWFGSGEKVKSR
jgi:dihydroceramidase